MKYNIIIFCLIISLLVLTGCSNKGIVGKWNYYKDNNANENIYYEFKEDKSGSYVFNDEVKNFMYELNDNKVELIYENATVSTFIEYKIKKDILIIKDSLNNEFSFKRVVE